MSRSARAALASAAVLVLGLASCDSEQPTQGSDLAAALSFSAQSGKVDIVDCYDATADDDGDGTPDTFIGVQCFNPPVPIPPESRPVPWTYSLEVSLLPAGSTTETVIGSSFDPDFIQDPFINACPFDATPATAAPARPPDLLADPDVYFLNARRVSKGSASYMASIRPGFTPNVFGDPDLAFDFEVEPGDTIIVRARKQKNQDGPPIFVSFDFIELTLAASLTLNGVPIQPQVGTLGTSTDNAAGVLFSFTTR